MVWRAPGLWGEAPGPLAHALRPLGALYGAVAAARLQRKAPRADLPTIVVGGLTSGGDGKTPLVLALARLLIDIGERPALLVRGYGGAEKGPTTVASERHDARAVGDEALLLAERALTIVGADRMASARLAKSQGATVLLLDDGFHSRALVPDLALLAIDADYGAGNGLCLPAGPLRAPLRAQLALADALVLIGAGEAWSEPPGSPPTLRARLAFRADGPALAGKKVFAFAGVGRPEKFRKSLLAAGAELCGFRAFPDHYNYSPYDLDTLEREARARDAILVTTRKDSQRLHADVTALEINLIFEDESEARLRVAAALAASRPQ